MAFGTMPQVNACSIPMGISWSRPERDSRLIHLLSGTGCSGYGREIRYEPMQQRSRIWVTWRTPGAVVRQVTGIAPVGQARAMGISTLNCHMLTPESEHTTHYFWAICRDFLLDNTELDKNMKMGAEYAFVEQDERMLSAIQDAIGNQDFWGLKPCLLLDDIGAVRVRRRMDDLLKAECVASAQSQAQSSSRSPQAV